MFAEMWTMNDKTVIVAVYIPAVSINLKSEKNVLFLMFRTGASLSYQHYFWRGHQHTFGSFKRTHIIISDHVSNKYVNAFGDKQPCQQQKSKMEFFLFRLVTTMRRNGNKETDLVSSLHQRCWLSCKWHLTRSDLVICVAICLCLLEIRAKEKYVK